MLTFESVLEVFKDYLAEDDMYEVVVTSHGYAVLEWNSVCEDWTEAKHCATPQDMRDCLLDDFVSYLEYQAADENGNIPDDARAEIEVRRQTLADRCVE